MWLTAYPLPITPMAAVDEQTDLRIGMAVPLQVNVTPPNIGSGTSVADSVWRRTVAAVIVAPSGPS